jgi:lipopolysaccharide/colanic/teichoic acid biosynthesis glycosyltransferase
VAAVLVVPAIGVAAITGILICLASHGPLYIRQEREGVHGAPFLVFKLRTMYLDAEEMLLRYLAKSSKEKMEWENYGSLRRDPRIAGIIAWFARRSSIDELPQLINVVKGQMNLVGPRPLPADIVSRMSASDREKRRKVKPGLTGLWQVSGRSELDIMKIGHLDSIYVNQRSILLDLHILVRTFWTVLGGRGAY